MVMRAGFSGDRRGLGVAGLGEHMLEVTFQGILGILPGIAFVGHKALEDGQAYRSWRSAGNILERRLAGGHW